MVSFIIPVKDDMMTTYVMMETDPFTACLVKPNSPSLKGFRTFLSASSLVVLGVRLCSRSWAILLLLAS